MKNDPIENLENRIYKDEDGNLQLSLPRKWITKE